MLLQSLVCRECGFTERIMPINRRCFACQCPYEEYMPMYPSWCEKCGRSFID
jgi:predicted Zn-ribbon and HTH transcriptional regulator